jgi:hypothetical protein
LLDQVSDIHRTDATLRFFGDDLDPQEIAAVLGCAPTVGVKKGGTWATKLGREKVARRGSWRLEAPTHIPGDLDGQIEGLFSALTTDLDAWRTLAARFQADIFCGVFLAEGNEGLELKPTTLLAVGARALKLSLDIYGPEMLPPTKAA